MKTLIITAVGILLGLQSLCNAETIKNPTGLDPFGIETGLPYVVHGTQEQAGSLICFIHNGPDGKRSVKSMKLERRALGEDPRYIEVISWLDKVVQTGKPEDEKLVITEVECE